MCLHHTVCFCHLCLAGAEGDSWISLQPSSQHCQAQVTSKSTAAPSPAQSSCHACPHGCCASAEAAAHSRGERGCKPQTPLRRSQWLCQSSTSAKIKSSQLTSMEAKQKHLLHHPFQTQHEASKKGLSFFSTTSACEDTLISARQEDFRL